MILHAYADLCVGFVYKLFNAHIPVCVADQHLCKGADLDGLVCKPRCLAPGIFAIGLEVAVHGFGFALPGMQCAVTLVPGMGDRFLNVADKVVVAVIFNEPCFFQVTLGYESAGQGELRARGILREFRYCKVIGYASPVREPLLVIST